MRSRKRWMARGVLVVGVLIPMLLVWLTGCWLFNRPPVAGFTVGPSTAGTAPFEVTLSAAPSSDPDGEIETYAWDFGDGSRGSGRNVSHTYTAAGTYTIVLEVEDKYGETDQAVKTVYVSPAEPAGPTASFTVTPNSGTSPLAVTVDASGTSYEAGVISTYEWTFGDGGYGYGKVATHTYFGAATYTITLTVTATDSKTGTTTKTVTVTATGGGGTPTGGAPSARFDILFDDPGPPVVEYTNTTIAPVRVWLDPADSEADEGRAIVSYSWSYGDGGAFSTTNKTPVTRTYSTTLSSKTYSATLVVIDDEGAIDSITKTVKVTNYLPIAGFEISDTLDDNAAPAGPAGTWVADDVDYYNVVADTSTVWIRSQQLQDDTGDWEGIDMANTDPIPNAKTSTPLNYDDHNFSYDPEGQTWDSGVKPDWFPNNAWGVQTLKVNWGDGTTDYVAFNAAGDTTKFHTYTFEGTTLTATITVTAIDYLGGESTPFSRVVTLYAGGG